MSHGATCVSIAAVHVSYYAEHKGHTNDVAHQQLTSDQRTQIAGMLSMGIPFEDVLERVQLSGDNSAVSRLHFLSRQDLQNITRDYGLARGIMQHANDAESVAAWVANQQTGDPMVRYVKFPGEEDKERGLSGQDFMLIIMSAAQIAGLNQLYRPMCEVALDSTHGTNAYDYQLTTLMVVDEHGEGFPAAFCFSNRIDESAMRIFLTICKETLGRVLENAVLMTDDAEAYHNAWCQVMGQPAHRLLCTWHIDRAWRKNLGKIHGDSLLKATIYKTLRALLEVKERAVFEDKMRSFLQCATEDDRTRDFAQYFDKQYATRPQVWAYCFRIGLQVHHNMHLEALHRVLKHVHMQGRKVRRMDKCIHALLRLMRTKMHDRLQKTHKGKWTRHVLAIRNRHKKGAACDGLVTVVIENKQYAVRGQKDVYLVEQCDTVPHTGSLCPLQCAECGICIHTFVCNCVDFGLRATICKHIHMVVSRFQPVISCMPESSCPADETDAVNQNNQQQDEQQTDSVLPEDSLDIEGEEEVTAASETITEEHETDAILRNFRNLKPAATLQHYIDIAEQQMSLIRGGIGENVEVAAAVCQRLTQTVALMNALRSKPQLPEPATAYEPVNKKAIQQRPFSSTKRLSRKRKTAESLSKPDEKEKAFLLATLDGNVAVISGTGNETDHDYDSHPNDVVVFEHNYTH